MKMRIPVALAAALALLTSTQLMAQVVDFETDGVGAPSGATIASNEYAGLGLLIEDSQGPSGMSSLIDTNPANIGTPISGKYVSVGAFSGVDTFVELMFPAGTPSLGFHWSTGAEATHVRVSLFDSADMPIVPTILDPADDTFVNNAGFTNPSGTFSAAPATPIHRVLIEDQSNGTRGLAIDNIRFQQVPEPASLMLAGCGVAALAATRRRK